MAYIQVEASVRTHKKFLKAGPAASWLWLCGMGYCQDGLTDGFIPFEAIDYLGIKGNTARKLKVTLVAVGLWEEVPGGWRVHDYLEHNKSAEMIRLTRGRRAEGGKNGGRPTKEETLPQTFEVSDKVNHTQNPSHLISSASTATATATPYEGKPLDVEFATFRDTYPQARRKGGYHVQQAYCAAAMNHGPAKLLNALRNHIASEQWGNPRLIPGMDTWLAEERWRQELPAMGTSAALSVTGKAAHEPEWVQRAKAAQRAARP